MGGRAGAAEPLLLPELSGGHSGGASVSGAVFNLSTSIIGGIMSIPAAMRVLGVAPALVLIAAVAVLSNVSVEFMLRYTGWAPSCPPSYAGIMGDAFGRAGAAALNVFVAFTTTGTLVVYLIIIGDVMSGSAGAGEEHAGVLGELFGARWLDIKNYTGEELCKNGLTWNAGITKRQPRIM
ncbi:hypothetical protein QYE76_055636 [Lolium multiflorum]|uniref:Amino acid transporter transmembrane domain-containing protein n=1 Tax=Lolium multiflorum TaxID=4521 RepID=A0AAD8WM25_LOLMU|nr:hypothetical protein QYE76_055636 [Lolium multiflorum]